MQFTVVLLGIEYFIIIPQLTLNVSVILNIEVHEPIPMVLDSEQLRLQIMLAYI